jgi:hypothetical protein
MNNEWQPSRSFVLLEVALLLVGCGIVAALWRAVDCQSVRDRQLLAQQQRFHTESIAALERLATNAGLLTSAELCPVRFRLRLGGGHTIPSFAGGEPHFRLWTCTEAGRESVMTSQMNAAGTVDFGLNPPGTYEVELRMPDGMFLLHEFAVLPGVPVDRLVCCPHTAMPGDLRMALDVDWPPAMADTNFNLK